MINIGNLQVIQAQEILTDQAVHVNYTDSEEVEEFGIEYEKGEFPFLANLRAITNMDSDDGLKVLSHEKLMHGKVFK